MYLLKIYKYIHAKCKLLNINVIHHVVLIGYTPHKQAGKFFVMLKYTLHTFTLTSSSITRVHVTFIQLQSNKILIIIYIKILNLDVQVYYCMTHLPKVSTQLAQMELIR